MAKSLHDFNTLTFDCYGTLIDWETGIWDAFQPLLMENPDQDATRAVVLEAYAIAESAQEAETPAMLYPRLLETVHKTVARGFGFKTNEDMDRLFGLSVPHWPAFPDTADALRILKRHFKLVILSNIYNEGFAAANRKLGVDFDAIYTAETIGSYKPSPRNFEYMLEHLESDLGIEKHQVLHTAQSLHHDHVPARQFGLSNAWIDRQGLNDSENWGATARVEQKPEFDFLFSTMGDMARAVQQA